jgi:MFS family permease
MTAYVQATFRSLRHRAYRLYFAGQTISIVGTWMQKVAQAWLVLELTGSGTLLGVTAGLQQLPTLLLTPWGGLLADRVDRRKILMWTQWAAAVPALVLGVLSMTDRITVPIVLALALTLGVVEAIDKPSRHTFPSDLVPREDIANALTLNNTMFNAGRVLGPAAAGLIISSMGVGVTFLLNALSFMAVFVMLVCIRPTDLQPRTPAPRTSGELREGLRYARRTPMILAPLALMTVTGLFAYEWNTAIPLLARTYSTSAETVGFFFAAMGAGAVIGSLAIAGVMTPTPRRLISVALAFALALGLTGAAPAEPLTLVCLFLLGATSTTLRSLTMSLVQLESAPAMRGRMVSLLIMAINGTSPVSGPLIGWVAERFSATAAIEMGATATTVGTLGTWVYLRRARVLGRAQDAAALGTGSVAAVREGQ